MSENNITWKSLEAELERFQKTEEVRAMGGHLFAVPYWLIPIDQTDQLSIGYLSFGLYKSLKENPYDRNIGRRSLRHLQEKYMLDRIKRSFQQDYIKVLLETLYMKYYSRLSGNPDFLYDYYVSSLVYEIILWKILKEYNRHRQAITEVDLDIKMLDDLVDDMIET